MQNVTSLLLALALVAGACGTGGTSASSSTSTSVATTTRRAPTPTSLTTTTTTPPCPVFRGITCDGFITDQAGVVEDDAGLEAEAAGIEEAYGAQVAVVVVTTVGDTPIGEFAQGLGNAWGVGSAERDDGVVVVVDIEGRETWIEYGDGLGSFPRHPTAMAALGNAGFRDDDFDGGISAILAGLAEGFDLFSDPDELLAHTVIISEADLPEGYTVTPEADTEESACDGVAAPGQQYPPKARRDVDVDRFPHILSAEVAVYDAFVAEDVFAYWLLVAEECDGRPATRDGEVARAEYRELDPPDLDVDEVAAFELTVSLPEIGIVATSFVARSGDAVLVTSGTDEATALSLMTIMVAKLTDEEPPPLVPPSTGLESWLVPKDDDGSPLAALLRFTVAEEGRLSSGFTEWVNAASDTEIDEIADRSCAALQEYEPEDDLTLTVRGLYDELPADDRETLDVETYAQLFGILSLLTCSELAQAVLLP